MFRAKSWVMCFAVIVSFVVPARGQSLPKVRAAYTSISIQFNPVYIMKELDLPRKYGLDVEVLFVPVSSRALQAALAGEIQFLTSGGVGNINANATGADFVGLTATLNTFVFKILASPDIKKPEQSCTTRIAGSMRKPPMKGVLGLPIDPLSSRVGFALLFSRALLGCECIRGSSLHPAPPCSRNILGPRNAAPRNCACDRTSGES